jgi:hypothetical protein
MYKTKFVSTTLSLPSWNIKLIETILFNHGFVSFATYVFIVSYRMNNALLNVIIYSVFHCKLTSNETLLEHDNFSFPASFSDPPFFYFFFFSFFCSVSTVIISLSPQHLLQPSVLGSDTTFLVYSRKRVVLKELQDPLVHQVNADT